MPEGVRPLPRWHGTLQPGSRLWTIAGDEITRARIATVPSLVVLVGLAWGLVSIIEMAQNADTATFQTWQPYLDMLSQLRWFALAAAAVIGGASLLEDHRRGALELYRTRVSGGTYLGGKAVAVVAITAFVVFLPAVAYYLASLVFMDTQPPDWHELALVGALAYALAWALLCAGLALGISAVSRSSLAAALLLLGGFVSLHIVASGVLLPQLVDDPEWGILSPMTGFARMETLIFPVESELAFPVLWGAIQWAGLTAIGWALVAWRRPRVRGDDHA